MRTLDYAGIFTPFRQRDLRVRPLYYPSRRRRPRRLHVRPLRYEDRAQRLDRRLKILLLSAIIVVWVFVCLFVGLGLDRRPPSPFG
jgi:hypothetical protein